MIQKYFSNRAAALVLLACALLAACKSTNQPLPLSGAGSMEAAKSLVLAQPLMDENAIEAAKAGLTFSEPVGTMEDGLAVIKVDVLYKVTGQQQRCVFELERYPRDEQYGWTVSKSVCRHVESGN